MDYGTMKHPHGNLLKKTHGTNAHVHIFCKIYTWWRLYYNPYNTELINTYYVDENGYVWMTFNREHLVRSIPTCTYVMWRTMIHREYLPRICLFINDEHDTLIYSAHVISE